MLSQDADGYRQPRSVFYQYPVCRGTAAARWAHSAAVAGTSVYVYGGVGASVMDDLQVLDTETMVWRSSVAGNRGSKDTPDKSLGHTLVSTGKHLWLFGGQHGRKFLRSLYCFDVDSFTWKQCGSSAGPSARAGHAMATVHDSHFFVFGGEGKRLYNDLFRFDVARRVWTEVAAGAGAPSPRRGHSLVWDGNDKLLCFGGITGGSTDSGLHVFSLQRNEWYQPSTTGKAPSPRTQHTAAMVSPGAMLVFGGCSSQGIFYNDLHVLDVQRWQWYQPDVLNPAPPPRYHHTCCIVGGKAYIFGGINAKQIFDGVIVLETQLNKELGAVAEELCKIGTASGITDTRNDVLTLQLTELLLKRNAQELQLKASMKAQAVQDELTAEKEAMIGLQRQLMQTSLVADEAERQCAELQVQLKDCKRELQAERQESEHLKASLQEVRSLLVEKEAKLQECMGLFSGVSKELGIVSSRYHSLTMRYDQLKQKYGEQQQRLKEKQRVAEGAGAASSLNADPDDCSCSSGSHAIPCTASEPAALASSPFEGIFLPQSFPGSAHCGDSEQPSTSSPEEWQSDIGYCVKALQHYQRLWSSAEAEKQDLELRTVQLEGRVASLEEEASSKSASLSLLEANPQSLVRCSLAELRGLEHKLSCSSLAVREAITLRTVSELHVGQSNCALCMERPKSFVFNCGHQCCELCCGKFTVCPFCRTAISATIRLFDA